MQIVSSENAVARKISGQPLMGMSSLHFLLLAFPVQSHINPALEFSKRLIRLGATVTFATSVYACRRMSKTRHLDGLTFASFSDGYDDGMRAGDDLHQYLFELRRRGSKTLAELIVSGEKTGHPVSCLVYTLTLPWAAEVASEHHVPSALLWIQPATVFDIYYYYFNGYEDVFEKENNDLTSSFIELPGLPLLTIRDVPSFLIPANLHAFGIPFFKEQIEVLAREKNPTILVNSFDALEFEALRAVKTVQLTPVGPLIPSAFLDKRYSFDTSFGGDIFHSDNDCIDWLNSKPSSSTVYVSFGSVSELSNQQNEEIAAALLDSGYPFLWVIRKKEKTTEEREKGGEERELRCSEELEKQGKIVPWCSQVEVLSHSSVGCFISHCGWNSTMESLVAGKPVVAFPQWTDQCTNAKLLEDEWRTGVRVKTGAEGVVEREEIRRCLEIVMGDGERGLEVKKNAEKWKELAMEAGRDGGSSDLNLKGFINEISDGHLAKRMAQLK